MARLLTFHGAKGLEFNRVVIINAVGRNRALMKRQNCLRTLRKKRRIILCSNDAREKQLS